MDMGYLVRTKLLSNESIHNYFEYVLASFFFKGEYPDDHTDELAKLKRQFTAIDTLIAKMKKRDELAPVYKEYKGKSGWSQSRFKKKNADKIEEYEQTFKYIK